MFESRDLPENHPLRVLFRTLTDRALDQASLSDRDLHRYLTELLTEFIHVERLYSIRDEEGKRVDYLVDMLALVQSSGRTRRRDHYKQIGDFSLFTLGMFPQSLSRPRRAIPKSYYTDTGKRCYLAASELEPDTGNTIVFRKLADRFDQCVVSLNWVREYTTDPFYRYMFREFGIT